MTTLTADDLLRADAFLTEYARLTPSYASVDEYLGLASRLREAAQGQINADARASNPVPHASASTDKGRSLGADNTDTGELPASSAPNAAFKVYGGAAGTETIRSVSKAEQAAVPDDPEDTARMPRELLQRAATYMDWNDSARSIGKELEAILSAAAELEAKHG